MALVGCAGKTTGANDITSNSATLNANVRCDSGESCKWYWEYWKASQPRSTSVKTTAAGPVDGPTGNIDLAINIKGLAANTAYRWVFCGSNNGGGSYGCVGPNGTVGGPTADPPPDYATFTTLSSATLAERWNGSTWTVQNTPNQGQTNDLNGVSCTSSTACTAVGHSGTATLAERWNGTSWTIQSTPAATGNRALYGVSCTSSTACIAVGSTGSGPLAEQWDGTNWTVQTTASLPAGSHDGRLGAVSCTLSTACTAVGSYSDSSNNPHLLAERWNGTSWALQSVPQPANDGRLDLVEVSCSSTTACTAVGSFYPPGSPGGPYIFETELAERWNGTAWTIQTTPGPPPDGSGRAFGGVSCSSATACSAVGYEFNASTDFAVTLAEGWNGTSWANQSTPSPDFTFFSELAGVSCTAPTACTAVGDHDGKDLAERWNGTSWSTQTTPNRGALRGVSCTSSTVCTAVGTQ